MGVYARSPLTLGREAATPGPAAASARPAWVYWLLVWIWIALLIYGSLLPFVFHLPPVLHHLRGWFDVTWWWRQYRPAWPSFLPWHHWLHGDGPMNVLLYMPVGLLWRMYARAKLRGWRAQWVAPVLFAGLLSLTMETGQIFVVHRVTSMQDIWMNLLGGTLGAWALVPLVLLLRRIIFFIYCRTTLWRAAAGARWANRRPHRRLAIGVMAAVVVAVLIQTALHPAEHRSRIEWPPFISAFAADYNIGITALAREWLLWLAVVTAWALAVLLAGGRIRWRWLVAAALALAVARQLIDYFLRTRTADTTDLFLAASAPGLLWLIVWAVRRAIVASCRRKQRRDVPFERRRLPHDYDSRPN